MIEAQNRIEFFMKAIPEQAKYIPEKPTIPPLEIRILRARLMLEECLETIDGLGLEVINKSGFGFQFIPSKEPDMIEIADGLADQLVVVIGTAVACGIGLKPILHEVLNNNDEKLTNGTVVNGKLVKHPDHPKPNIALRLEMQGWKENKHER